MKKREWPDACSTCKSTYHKTKDAKEICVCSNPFHLCRNCVWYGGKRIVICEPCKVDEENAKREWDEEVKMITDHSKRMMRKLYDKEQWEHTQEQETKQK